MEPEENSIQARQTTDALLAEDAAMAVRCQSDDLHGYEHLYVLHGARMNNLARNMLGNSMDADDAVQETLSQRVVSSPTL